ncbi:hypothetical protein MFLAVUS_007842 [Mucor flavus]|uniref:Uncharacterized protein n=1 Tax=Mucor flavus TaxID=439312 RepID=A0ABP9Z5E9_9FUNG
MVPSWVWAIVAIILCLLLAILIYTIYKKKRTRTLNKDEEEKRDVPVPLQTTPFDPKSIRSQDTMQLYGQQFALVEPSQTALSPPPQREPKTCALLSPQLPLEPKTCTLSDIATSPIDSLPKNRGVFSLSPHQDTDDSTIQDNSSTTRTITPFQGTTDWRGPTPPWTQH